MDVATIYIDCTTTRNSPLQTGIQRVVRNVVRCGAAAAAARGVAAVPVYLGPSGFHRAPLTALGELVLAAAPLSLYQRNAKRVYWGLLRALASLAPHSRTEWLLAPASRDGLSRRLRKVAHRARLHRSRQWHDDGAPLIEFTSRDILLLLDLSLDSRLPDALEAVRRRGTRVVCVCHDLIPALHPQGLPQTFVEDFRQWMDEVLAGSDGVVTISRTVADDVRAFLVSRAGAPAYVAAFRLGCDFVPEAGQHGVRARIAGLFERRDNAPVFLAIGWIDIRKNQGVLLDALLQLQARGIAARLVIIGKRGTNAAALMQRIRRHAVLRRIVSVHEDATDAEVDFAYRHCSALLYPSLVEGFGLPLVEALVRGTPVFASDIPVFREIAGGYAVHFPPHDADRLAQLLHGFATTGVFASARPIHQFAWPGWSASTGELFDCTLAAVAA